MQAAIKFAFHVNLPRIENIGEEGHDIESAKLNQLRCRKIKPRLTTPEGYIASDSGSHKTPACEECSAVSLQSQRSLEWKSNARLNQQ